MVHTLGLPPHRAPALPEGALYQVGPFYLSPALPESLDESALWDETILFLQKPYKDQVGPGLSVQIQSEFSQEAMCSEECVLFINMNNISWYLWHGLDGNPLAG